MSFIDKLKFNSDGLIPAIVQEHSSGRVLMMAWMNRESIEKTVELGKTVFWSRSRQKYWIKGETSGHFQQVKDIAKPALDHERRLLAAFARNVHEYHRELGKDASGLRFVRVELPEDKVKWMKVGSEGNRVGYFRVLRSRLVVATGSDKERSFELTSMISWRGEWYVVHLHGFK